MQSFSISASKGSSCESKSDVLVLHASIHISVTVPSFVLLFCGF